MREWWRSRLLFDVRMGLCVLLLCVFARWGVGVSGSEWAVAVDYGAGALVAVAEDGGGGVVEAGVGVGWTEDAEALRARWVGVSRPVFGLEFDPQLPLAPGVYDAPLVSRTGCQIALGPMPVRWMEPLDGVTSETGLLVFLSGINPALDCERVFDPPNEEWCDSRNVVQAGVFYRNAAFMYPYDFGKHQVTDVLRGLGSVLDRYPQIDRRRLYLYGGSGGGHVALQTLQVSRGLWAEVYVHAAITKITVPSEVLAGYPEDPGGGWNVNLLFPLSAAGLDWETWTRYRAERDLRSPILHVGADAVYGEEGAGDGLPEVWMMHGTLDPTVDVRHFHAYREALEGAAGRGAELVSANRWRLGNWEFAAIAGGNHSYAGGPAGQTTRALATEHFNPACFTRRQERAPALRIEACFPSAHGWEWCVEGDGLVETRLTVRALRPTGWMLMP